MGKQDKQSSAAVLKYLNYHNNMVHSAGLCDKCERVNAQDIMKVAVD